jgi:hypothetical protein
MACNSSMLIRKRNFAFISSLMIEGMLSKRVSWLLGNLERGLVNKVLKKDLASRQISAWPSITWYGNHLIQFFKFYFEPFYSEFFYGKMLSSYLHPSTIEFSNFELV